MQFPGRLPPLSAWGGRVDQGLGAEQGERDSAAKLAYEIKQFVFFGGIPGLISLQFLILYGSCRLYM